MSFSLVIPALADPPLTCICNVASETCQLLRPANMLPYMGLYRPLARLHWKGPRC